MTLSMKKCMSTSKTGTTVWTRGRGCGSLGPACQEQFWVFIARQGMVLGLYLIKSFMTSPAIIRPATDGTNEMLPGI